MRFKGIQFLFATAAALLFSSYVIYKSGTSSLPVLDGQSAEKDKMILKVLMETVKSHHYQTHAIDDRFSHDVFDLYLKRIDFSKRFLLKQDVESLEVYRDKLDDQINAADYTFFERSFDIFQARLKESQEYYREILATPFDFTVDERLELDEEKRDFAVTREELKDYWRKLLKYQVLTRIVEMEEEQEQVQEASDTAKVLTFDEMEAKARTNLMKSNDRFYERMSKWNHDDQLEVYLNSIMNIYDPHTSFFPPQDKENFDISMSGQLEGIGAQLQERDGFIRVTNIVPGSASHRQGELEEGDLILKVAQAADEPVDVTDMRLDDAVKLIRGKKGTEVRLTIKKITGEIKIISIIRDVVILEETYAKSAIVENERGQKVGYIFLPKFYADFNKLGGRAAAEDVKQELIKLKAAEVQGIILDLRGNGGGSLRDAVDMVGHFIPYGPVVQVKGRYGSPEIMSDNDKSVVYDGPLVVMMNQFSASASEIVAAAVQDYDRGVIMGTPSSFGKGTVQRFIDLDRSLTAGNQELRPMGALKITTQKFYRINGGATQLRGVESDIVFPDRYAYFEMGEKEQDFAMTWDEIQKADFTTWRPFYDEKQIINASRKRIEASEIMREINTNAQRLKQQSDETNVTLKYADFVEMQKQMDKESDAFEDLFTPIEKLEVKNLQVDYETIANDSIKVELNEKWLKKLRKDYYLNEAINVVSDMRSGV